MNCIVIYIDETIFIRKVNFFLKKSFLLQMVKQVVDNVKLLNTNSFDYSI